jgi:hypothetical protein
MRRSFLWLFVVAALSCSSGAAPKVTRVPALHRAAATPCTADRGPGVSAGSCIGNSNAQCHSDADCTAGANGRCSQMPKGVCNQQCTYDKCTSDSDCTGGAPCACRRPDSGLPTDPPPNICVSESNCRTDADCGEGGYCSPTTIDDVCGCIGPCPDDAGQECWSGDCGHGYFCHTAKDTCVDDADCQDGMICNFDLPSQSWKCGREACPS